MHSFRRARPGDALAIVALVHSAYRGDASRVGWTTEADLLDGQRTDVEQIEVLVDGPRTQIVLMHVREVLVGSVLVAREADALYVGMLAVDPASQARGYGRALLDEVERIARAEQRVATLRMTVIGQRQELIAWYERRGYLRTGRREPFPYGEPRFGLPRRPDLYFEVLEKRLGP